MDEEHKLKCEHLYVEGIMLLTEDGYIEPTFFLLKNGETIVIEGVDYFKNGKEETINLVTKIAKMEEADAVMMISEAYQSKNFKYFDNPKEDPDVINVCNLMYITPDGKTKGIITGKVKKTPAGVPYVEHWEWMNKVGKIPFLEAWM